MTAAPDQPTLDFPMGVQPLDEVIVSAKVLLQRPEVEYTIIWQGKHCRRSVQKCYLDSIWPLDRMIGRIFAMMHSVFGDEAWEPKKVRAVLDALQSAYGCEEPF